MRARITARFAELHADREQAEAQLAALAAITPKAADPTLLEELPLAGTDTMTLPKTPTGNPHAGRICSNPR